MVKKKKAQNEIQSQKEGEKVLLVKALMLSALPNLFLIRCANSLGFDITVLKKSQLLQTIHCNGTNRLYVIHNRQHSTYPDKPVIPSLMLPPTFLETIQKAVPYSTMKQVMIFMRKATTQPLHNISRQT
jgi:hypothetical protein